MNPAVKEVLVNNAADVEAIIAKIGIGTLLSLMPHIINILETIQKVQKS
jgi:hypothetical protein